MRDRWDVASLATRVNHGAAFCMWVWALSNLAYGFLLHAGTGSRSRWMESRSAGSGADRDELLASDIESGKVLDRHGPSELNRNSRRIWFCDVILEASEDSAGFILADPQTFGQPPRPDDEDCSRCLSAQGWVELAARLCEMHPSASQ